MLILTTKHLHTPPDLAYGMEGWVVTLDKQSEKQQKFITVNLKKRTPSLKSKQFEVIRNDSIRVDMSEVVEYIFVYRLDKTGLIIIM